MTDIATAYQDNAEAKGDTGRCGTSYGGLLNSHGLVLIYVALTPEVTLRQIAENLELTERRVVDIVRDLSRTGFLKVDRVGRRNRYRLSPKASFRHPVLADVPVAQFIGMWRKNNRHEAWQHRIGDLSN
jgi:DNA-binding MarR family transcriptional regulator